MLDVPTLHHQLAVTQLENVRQLNIGRGKKLGFQLSHTQPLKLQLKARIFLQIATIDTVILKDILKEIL